MAELVYYCKKENNACPKREECKRYMESDDKECISTLFKCSCTESNNFLLYMKYDKEDDKEERKDGE